MCQDIFILGNGLVSNRPQVNAKSMFIETDIWDELEIYTFF